MADVRSLLQALTVPDTNVVAQATVAIREQLRFDKTTGKLLELLGDQDVAIRQLSAVLLRRVLPDRLRASTAVEIKSVRNAVLSALAVEQNAPARTALISLAASVAFSTEPGSKCPNASPWVELLNVAFSGHACSLQLITALADTVSTLLFKEIPPLVESLSAALIACVPRCVSAYAAVLLAAGAVLRSTPPALIALLPKLADTVKAYAAQDASTDAFARIAADAFECCQHGAESGGDDMRAYFPASISLAVEMFRSRNAAAEARSAAAEYLMFAASHKPRTFRKLGIVPVMLTAFCEIAAEFSVPEADDEDPDDEENPCDVALRVLDVMSKRPELTMSVFTAVVSAATALLDCAKQDTTASARDSHSAAAFRIMGVVAEGCAVSVTEHAVDIVSKVSEGVINAGLGAHARANALNALGLVCEALETDEMPEAVISSVGGIALNAIIVGMRDAVLQVRRTACASLEPVLSMCLLDISTLQPRIAEIIGALGSLGTDAAVEAVMAIGVLAENAPEEFVSYERMPDLVRATLAQMSRTDEEGLLARAAGTETAGALVSVIDDHSVIEQFATTAVVGLQIDEPSIKRATYSFFARMADSIGGTVVVAYGPKVLTAAFESMTRDDVVFEPRDDEANGGMQGIASAVAGDENDGDDDHDEKGTYHVRTAFLDEKMLAVAVFGAFASASSSVEYVSAVEKHPQIAKEVQSLFSKALDMVDDLSLYFHEEVRAATHKTGVRFSIANVQLGKICPALIFDNTDTVSTTAQRIAHCIQEDNDRWVVEGVLNAAVVLCNELAPEDIVTYKDILIAALDSIIKGNTLCQLVDDVELDDDDDDGEIGDGVTGIASGICDLVEALVRNQRGLFADDMKHIFQVLMEHMFSSSIRNRAVVFGGITGVLLFLNWDRCTKFTPPAPGTPEHELPLQVSDAIAAQLLPHALEALSAKKGMTIQRNALFLVGLIFQRARSGNQAVWTNFQRAVALLQEYLLSAKSGDNAALVDNAAGAVARIIMAPGLRAGALGNRSTALQLLMRPIPMRGDPQENTTVARAIVFVAEPDFSAILPFVEPVVSCLSSALLLALAQRKEDEKPRRWNGERMDRDENDLMARLTNEECEKIVQVLSQIRRQFGDAPFNSMGLSHEDAAALAAVISSQA